MIGYTIKVDEEALSGAISLMKFVGANTTKAQRWAINKTLPIAKTRSAKTIYDSILLKSSVIKSRIEVDKATVYNLSGRLYMDPKGLSLQKYEYGGAKVAFIGGARIVTPDSPIRVKVKRTGAIKPVTGIGKPGVEGKPFYFLLSNTNAMAIGMWKIKTGSRGGRIKMLYGPSVSQLFDDVKEELRPEFEELYKTQLIAQMNSVLQLKHPG